MIDNFGYSYKKYTRFTLPKQNPVERAEKNHQIHHALAGMLDQVAKSCYYPNSHFKDMRCLAFLALHEW